VKTLTKEIGLATADVQGGEIVQLIANPGGGWTLIPGSGNMYYETYFDLAGMTEQEKTLFFTGATTQNANPVISNPATVGNNVHIWDIMATKPLTETDLLFVAIYGNTASPGVVLTFDQTVYLRNRVMNTDIDNAAASVMIPIFDEQLGSLEATASDRVYCYRLVSITGADAAYTIYPVRYILRAEAKEEPEYEYLMRLKRSYELQNQPDRD